MIFEFVINGIKEKSGISEPSNEIHKDNFEPLPFKIVKRQDVGFLKKVNGLYSRISRIFGSFSLVNFYKDNYLLHERAFSNRKHRLISCIVLLIWFILVLFVAFHHEVWRDEMRAYVIADNASSVFDIPELLINDGHPPLWHFLLYLVNYFVGTPLTLQITAISITQVANMRA